MPLIRFNDTLMLFMHVPRTGGTYVETVLRDSIVGLKRTDHGAIKAAGMPCSPQHFHRDILSMLINAAALDWCFMTVRHPLDRLFSVYRHRKHIKDQEAIKRDFNDWVAFIDPIRRQHPFIMDNHARPAVDFLMPKTEVFRLEDGMDALFEGIGRASGKAIVVNNTGGHKSNTAPSESISVTGQTLDLVRSSYGDDFRMFHYKLEEASLLAQ